MSTLHLLTRSEYPSDLLAVFGTDDKLVYLAEGTYALLTPLPSELSQAERYVLHEELCLRGLSEHSSSAQNITYQQLLPLIGATARSITW